MHVYMVLLSPFIRAWPAVARPQARALQRWQASLPKFLLRGALRLRLGAKQRAAGAAPQALCPECLQPRRLFIQAEASQDLTRGHGSQRWLVKGSMLGAVLPRLLPSEPIRRSRRGPSGRPEARACPRPRREEAFGQKVALAKEPLTSRRAQAAMF